MLPMLNIISIQPHLALPDYNRADCNHSRCLALDPASVPLLFVYIPIYVCSKESSGAMIQQYELVKLMQATVTHIDTPS